MQFYKFLLFLLMGFLPVLTQAQAFQFIDAQPDTFSVDANEFDFTVFFSITNTSADTLEVSAQRADNNMAPGHSSFFCWDFCYDTTVNLSDFPITIAPGDTTRFQYITFVPGGINGQSSVTMRFFTADTSQGTLERTYDYKATGGITASIFSRSFKGIFELYPNPAQDILYVNVESEKGIQDMSVEVYDVQGKVLLARQLDNQIGALALPVEEMPNGVYWVSLRNKEGILTSKKFLIQE